MKKKFPVQNIPLYLKVKTILLEAIQTGKIGQNGKLPPEKVLSDQFKVSRATIRSTLQSLEKDGLITRRHGIGSFINNGGLQVKMRINEAKGFFQLIRDSGHTPSIDKTVLKPVIMDEKLCRLMDMTQNRNALLLERLFWGDGKPAIFVSEFIPTANLIQEPEPGEIPHSIFEFADYFLHDSIEYSISEIIPTRADAGLRKKMLLEPGETLLKLEELHYSKQDKPIVFSIVYVRDQLIRFRVVRKRQQF